jgi:hypothetical protein
VWQKIQVDASTVQQGGGVAVPAVDGVTQMGLNHPLVAMLVQVRGWFACMGNGSEGGGMC